MANVHSMLAWYLADLGETVQLQTRHVAVVHVTSTAVMSPDFVLGANLVQVIICFNCSFDMPTVLNQMYQLTRCTSIPCSSLSRTDRLHE